MIDWSYPVKHSGPSPHHGRDSSNNFIPRRIDGDHRGNRRGNRRPIARGSSPQPKERHTDESRACRLLGMQHGDDQPLYVIGDAFRETRQRASPIHALEGGGVACEVCEDQCVIPGAINTADIWGEKRLRNTRHFGTLGRGVIIRKLRTMRITEHAALNFGSTVFNSSLKNWDLARRKIIQSNASTTMVTTNRAMCDGQHESSNTTMSERTAALRLTGKHKHSRNGYANQIYTNPQSCIDFD